MSYIFATDVPFAYFEHEEYDLYYDVERNLFIDEDGLVVCNIFTFITPNDLMLFKSKRRDMRLHDSSGKGINLIWNN